MSWAKIDKNKIFGVDLDIKDQRDELPDKSYFNLTDIAIVKTQNGKTPAPSVVGYTVKPMRFKKKDDTFKYFYALYAVETKTTAGHTSLHEADGDIIALSCPNFNDKDGGNEDKLDE